MSGTDAYRPHGEELMDGEPTGGELRRAVFAVMPGVTSLQADYVARAVLRVAQKLVLDAPAPAPDYRPRLEEARTHADRALSWLGSVSGADHLERSALSGARREIARVLDVLDNTASVDREGAG